MLNDIHSLESSRDSLVRALAQLQVDGIPSNAVSVEFQN